MALSGSIAGWSSNQYIDVTLDWSATQDVVANKSTITVTIWARRNNIGYVTSGTLAATIYINGEGFGVSGQRSISTSWVALGSASKTITHAADGVLSIPLAMSGGISGAGWSFSLAETWRAIDTIPRASSFSLSSAAVMGSPLTISIDRASSSFTHTVKYAFGALSGTIATGVATSTGWTPPLSLATQIPNNISGTGTITVETYSGATLIGSKAQTVTIDTPASMIPTIGSLTVTDTTGTLALIGAWVQDASIAQAVINGAAGVQGSTITAYSVSVSGQEAIGATTQIPITQAGILTLTATVTDSRGRVGTKTQTLTVLAYSPPRFTAAPSLRRATAAGVIAELGTYLKTSLAAAATSLKPASIEKNTLTLTVKSREKGSTGAWTTLTTLTGLTIMSTATIGGSLAAATAYDLQLDLVDKLSTTTQLISLPTSSVPLSLGKTGIGVGKIWEQGGLDIAGDAYHDGFPLPIPAGTIHAYAGATAPAGYALCDGQLLLRASYPKLFAAIGTVYGSTLSTNFRVPNLLGRVPVGRDSAQAEFDVLGETGGAKTHTLTVDQMPAHSHPGKSGWSFAMQVANSNAGAGGLLYAGTQQAMTTGDAGGGSAHPILQPYMALNYIIKLG